MDRDARDGHEETRRAWDVVARAKYRDELDGHVRLLAAGGHNLLEPELAVLGPLLPGARVVHLQCSHGLDTIGLLNLGAASVVGIDISGEMIDQAREKADILRMERARFIRADAVDPPEELSDTADLVYTGRGSLPWILDLEAWGRAVRRLLRPGGSVFVFEGHPLDALWERDRAGLVLRPGAGYFDDKPGERPGFPASVVERASEAESACAPGCGSVTGDRARSYRPWRSPGSRSVASRSIRSCSGTSSPAGRRNSARGSPTRIRCWP